MKLRSLLLLATCCGLSTACQSTTKPGELTDELKVCLASSNITYTLAQYRDTGLDKNAALTKALATAGAQANNLSAYLRSETDLVYAIPQWSRDSFSYFRWSTCKVEQTNHKKLETPFPKEMVNEVNFCEATYRRSLEPSEWRECVEQAVLLHSH